MNAPNANDVIREHAAFVWRVLRHLGVAEPQLPDLSQEVFVIVLHQLPGFEGRSSLRTWIFGICRNVAQRARSQGRLMRELPLAPSAEPSEPESQERALWLKQAHAQLVAALGALDEDQRSVFVLYEIEEMPMEEIASMLQTPVTTCYSRLTSARKRIEAELRRGQQKSSFRLLKGGAR